MRPIKSLATVALLIAALFGFGSFMASVGRNQPAEAIPQPHQAAMHDLELARLRALLANQALTISQPDRPDREETSSGVTVFRGTPR